MQIGLNQIDESVLAHLTINGSISNKEACEQFGISRMTAYRVFKKLEDLNFATLSRGAAVFKPTERDFSSKTFLHTAQKRKIAAWTAQNLIASGCSLFLEAGTTVSYVLEHIKANQPAALMSNGLETLQLALQLLPESEVIGCGGVLRPRSQSFVGSEARQFFLNHHADIALLSTTGCHLEYGFTDINKLEGEVKAAMIGRAKRRIMLADSSKIHQTSVAKFAEISDVDVFVTNSDADPAFVARLQAMKIDCYCV